MPQFAEALGEAQAYCNSATKWSQSSVAYVCAGIRGEKPQATLLVGRTGPAGLDRQCREPPASDVLRQPGARYVIVLEGINDLGFSQLDGN